jgi:hypothetical protein
VPINDELGAEASQQSRQYTNEKKRNARRVLDKYHIISLAKEKFPE